MLWSGRRRGRPQKPSSRPWEGVLCKILQMNFYEKALFVKVDVATALGLTQLLLSALRAMLLSAVIPFRFVDGIMKAWQRYSTRR
jgi:hypothetical protein